MASAKGKYVGLFATIEEAGRAAAEMRRELMPFTQN